jgi:MYXO-CTERM domain-containing protein
MIHKLNTLGSVSAIVLLAGVADAELIYGVTNSNTLVSWDSSDSSDLLGGVAVSGLMQNEQIRGIDFRPATGQLYAVGSFNNLYTVDTTSGQATLVGGGSFAPGASGASFGFDFNPTIDRIRYVSDANQNLVLNPNDGTATEVTSLFYDGGDVNAGMDPNVVGSAYTNSFMGSTSTQLYGIDSALDILVTQANSAGTLMTVGSLGVDVNDTLSFDISGLTGIAYATVQSDDLSRSTFWMIDLSTGDATMLGEIGGGAVVSSMAVTPAPGALALLGLGGLAASRRRR